MPRYISLRIICFTLSCGLSVGAQEDAFDADFDASTTENPTDVTNLNAGTTLGSWSDVPTSANIVGIFDSGGDKGFLLDQASANFEVNAQLDYSVVVGDDTEISFSYGIRRSTGNHSKDLTVTGYDLTDAVSFQIAITAVSSGSDRMRVAYIDPTNGYTNVPAGSAGDHNYMGSWDPSNLTDIKLTLGNSGYVIELDGDDGLWTSATLPYAGSATALDRIAFSGRGGSSGVACGFWLDDLLVNGVSAQIIESFTSDVSYISPGDPVQFDWQLSSFDTVTLDGVDVSGLTTGGSGSTTQSVAETHYYELVGTKGSRTETVGILVFADVAPLRITEVMSDNDDTLSAADGSSPDWIEITNFSDSSFDLAGWFLTDDALNLPKWAFPAGSIVPAQESLIVFASDDPPVVGELHASFKLGKNEYLALVSDDGTTILQEFSPFLPAMHEDISYGFGPDLASVGFFKTPTPGSLNGALTQETGPLLDNLTEDPPFSAGGITISIEADANGSPLTDVTLHYTIGFGAETQLAMTPSTGNLWTVTLPTAAVGEGEMIRWRATATDALGRVTPFPTNVPADVTPRYHGVVADDSSINTAYPVLHTFIEDPDWYKNSGWDEDGRTGKSNNKNYEPVSLSFNGRFYDNAQIRVRGNSAGRWEKPKFKVELNEGYELEWDPSEEAVDEFNLQSHYVDQYTSSAKTSFIREYAYLDLANEVGMPAFHMFYLQMRQNSDYFGLYSFTEQVDATFLRRNDLDDKGALYKATDGGDLETGSGTEDHYSKATRKSEPYDDLVALIDELNATEPARSDYVFDHLDLPGIINKFAVDVLTHNYDRSHHNFYVHHNREKDEWTQLVWDLDLNFLVNSRADNPDFNHPLYLDGNDDRRFNGMSYAIFNNDVAREMYFRRLRNILDDYLATTWLENRFLALDSQIEAERTFDKTVWSSMVLVNVQTDLIDEYIPNRIDQLYSPDIWGDLLPDPEPANPSLSFGQIVANPVSGNQDEEFIEITNPNNWAVDVSNWGLIGGVNFDFPPGSVIPSNSSCYLSPDVISFRNRAASPTGGERRLVLGNYNGHLSNLGETLTLVDETSVLVAQITLAAAQTENQLYLIISEVMYNPMPDIEAEFIELLNISDTLTLDLGGVQFTDGILYTFPIGTMLAPGARIVVNKSEFTSGSLSNGGETIKLDDADGSTIADFTYNDKAPWPLTPDTLGNSLVYISGDPDEAINWRASTSIGGNPGASDTVSYVDGNLLDYALDGELTYDFTTGILSATKKSGADDATLTPQRSTDLDNWSSEGFIFLGSEPFQWERAISEPHEFFRITVEATLPE